MTQSPSPSNPMPHPSQSLLNLFSAGLITPRSLLLRSLLLGALLTPSDGLLAQSPPSKVDGTKIGEIEFHLASGWSLKNGTAEGLTVWPIAATWDSHGNLVVAESAGGGATVQQQLEQRPHRVVRLIDSDKDGIFETRQIVYQGLPFPEGVLCVGNDVLVSAPPQILRLVDADGDGVAERQETWHDGKTLTGCANDLHGPFLGPEGWIYWCKAAFAEQTIPISGPFSGTSSASHLYRKQIGAPTSDRIMTGGMDNLVDVTFDDLGDKFFVATFLHRPGAGLRDGLGHAVYGAVFGKENAVLQGHPRTGPLMKPLVEMGPAAPPGILAVTNMGFPGSFPAEATTLVAAQFNLQRISMHHLQRQGASYTTTNSDILTSDQIDFHPVDLLQDIDGSLLVVDTGGWYDLCCPSSGAEDRIAPGGIYRLSPEGAGAFPQRGPGVSPGTALATPGGTHKPRAHESVLSLLRQGDWKGLLLSDQRRVREIGTQSWLDSGADVDAEGKVIDQTDWLVAMALDMNLPTANRAAAFWAYARWIEKHGRTERTPSLVKTLLDRNDDPLTQSALHLTSTYRWDDAIDRLTTLVQANEPPMLRRLAAECLGRIGNESAIPALLESAKSMAGTGSSESDRVLQHAVLFALMEIGANRENGKGIGELVDALKTSSNPKVQFAALHVLNELGRLDVDLIPHLVAAVQSNDPELSSLAEIVIARDAPSLDAYLKFLATLSEADLAKQASGVTRVLRRGRTLPPAQSWILAHLLEESPTKESWKRELLKVILADYRNQPLPTGWGDRLVPYLDTSAPYGEELLILLKEIAIPASETKLVATLAELTRSSNFVTALHAVGASPRGSIELPEETQKRIVSQLLESSSSETGLAWQAVQRIDLKNAPWQQLLRGLDQFSPVEYSKGIEVLALSRVAKEDTTSDILVRAIAAQPATKTLNPAVVDRWFASFRAEVRQRVTEVLAAALAPPADMQASIDATLQSLPEGNATRGQDLFRSSKGACAACHRIGYVGGTLGPELTRIGKSRTRRDFVEAILFPSHRIEQGFSSTSILTVDDEVITGIVTFEDEQRVEVAVSADKKVSVPKSEIETRNESATSLMPAGIDQLLNPQELADLLSFLEKSK